MLPAATRGARSPNASWQLTITARAKVGDERLPERADRLPGAHPGRSREVVSGSRAIQRPGDDRESGRSARTQDCGRAHDRSWMVPWVARRWRSGLRCPAHETNTAAETKTASSRGSTQTRPRPQDIAGPVATAKYARSAEETSQAQPSPEFSIVRTAVPHDRAVMIVPMNTAPRRPAGIMMTTSELRLKKCGRPARGGQAGPAGTGRQPASPVSGQLGERGTRGEQLVIDQHEGRRPVTTRGGLPHSWSCAQAGPGGITATTRRPGQRAAAALAAVRQRRRERRRRSWRVASTTSTGGHRIIITRVRRLSQLPDSFRSSPHRCPMAQSRSDSQRISRR